MNLRYWIVRVFCGAAVSLAVAQTQENLLQGAPLTAKILAAGPAVKLLASFEDKNPFGGGTVVENHATEGSQALRIDRSYVGMDGAQDWTGYNYLKAELYTDSHEPVSL